MQINPILASQVHTFDISPDTILSERMHAWRREANFRASMRQPFFFMIDFEMEKPCIYSAGEADNAGISFELQMFNRPGSHQLERPGSIHLDLLKPVDRDSYQKAFNLVQEHLQRGDSYLLNLTFPTVVNTELSLSALYQQAVAPYKLYVPGKFVSFSPECFVRIEDDYIYSYPMKGTIDANLPDAAQRILADEKEKREHHTIVDLIRNDLALIAREVTVTRLRYLDLIRSGQKNLLQVSSEIRGRLVPDWHHHLGDMVASMLPAGSISGAPKRKTIQIIKEAEKQIRGYYTGIFGYFDGYSLDSAVIIRYLEQRHGQLWYRSGGGITVQSDADSEYQEMLDKVYVPTF